MLFAYGDESSDESRQRVFAVGAIIGSEQHWNELEIRWTARTSGTPFHANDCDSDRGEYSDSPHVANKALYADLIRILVESDLGGYAVAIDLASQREMFPEAADMSYYKGICEVVKHMKNCAHFNYEKVQFIFDSRQETAHNTSFLFASLQKIPEWSPYIGELSFARSKESPRLQASDLFVREVMKAWDNRVAPIKRGMRKSWKALVETGRFHGEVLGLPWFTSLKNNLPQLEKQTGMSMETYAEWLRERKLGADNISNRFLYIASLDQEDS